MMMPAAAATAATIYDNRTKEERRIDVDAVLINLGFKAALGPIAGCGLELADNRHIRVDGKMETNLSGVFAAGDIVRGASLVVWAIRDGRDAAESIHRYLQNSAASRTLEAVAAAE